LYYLNLATETITNKEIMKVLLCAFGFFLILEGLFPMINPDLWKEFLQTASRIPSKKIRNFAFGSVVFGLLIVWIAMSF